MNAVTTPAVSATPPAPGIPDDSVAMIGRQAILNERREVFGYELFDRTTAAAVHTAASDAAMLFNALSYTGTETYVSLWIYISEK